MLLLAAELAQVAELKLARLVLVRTSFRPSLIKKCRTDIYCWIDGDLIFVPCGRCCCCCCCSRRVCARGCRVQCHWQREDADVVARAAAVRHHSYCPRLCALT